MSVVIDNLSPDQIEQLRAYVGAEPVDDALRNSRVVVCDECSGDGWNDTSTGHAWLCWRCETWAWAYNLRTGMWSALEK